VLVYQLALNLVLQSDLLVFKAILARRAVTAAASGLAVNDLVGIYKAVQNFAFLPYQLLLAVTFVIFPVVSRATLEGDRDTTARFVAGATRFSLLALGAMLAVLTGLPRGVLRIAYRPPFDEGLRGPAAALRSPGVLRPLGHLHHHPRGRGAHPSGLAAHGRDAADGHRGQRRGAHLRAGRHGGPRGHGGGHAHGLRAGARAHRAVGEEGLRGLRGPRDGAARGPVHHGGGGDGGGRPVAGQGGDAGPRGAWPVAVYAACIALSRELTGDEIGRIVRVLRKTGPKG
jgi:hypothetical protein